MMRLQGPFRTGTVLVPVLAVLFAGCEPEKGTGPRIPIESTNSGNVAQSEGPENAGNGNGENAENGNGDESGNGGEAGAEGRGEVFEITADDTMRFGLARFEVDPGQRVTVVLENIGSMSKDVMGHNFVLLELGTDPLAFASDAIPHRDNEHIPPGREDEVIVATDIIGPGETAEISFVAPDAAGDYDYICSFPGHTAAGMVGVMTVRAEAEEAGDGSAQEGDETEGNGETGEEEADGEEDRPEENGEADGEEDTGEPDGDAEEGEEENGDTG